MLWAFVYLVGIKIVRRQDSPGLSKSHYIDKILKKFNKDNNQLVRTSLDTNVYLSKNHGGCIS